MRVRATSDLHLSETTEAWGFTALEIVAHGLGPGDALVLVGDIFDQGLFVPMAVWNRLRDFLAGLAACGVRVYVVVGNHDQYGHAGRNCLEGLHAPELGVVVVSEAQWTPLGLMVPYTEPGSWHAAVRAAGEAPTGDNAPPSIVWAHQGFKGAYMNRMRRDTGGLPVADLPGKVLITGHYHMPQNLGYVIYCGSPYQTSFAEEGQIKSFLEWPDVHADPLPQRVPYPDLGAPQHWTVPWQPGTPDPVMPDGHRSGDRVRIVAPVAASEVPKLEGAEVVVKRDPAEVTRGVVQSSDPRDAVEEYVIAVNGPDVNAPDPLDVLEYAREELGWRA